MAQLAAALREPAQGVNLDLVEHARTLMERAANDARGAAELLREGTFPEHAEGWFGR